MFRPLGSFLALAFAMAVVQAPRAQSPPGAPPGRVTTRNPAAAKSYGTHFQTSDRCLACHNVDAHYAEVAEIDVGYDRVSG